MFDAKLLSVGLLKMEYIAIFQVILCKVLKVKEFLLKFIMLLLALSLVSCSTIQKTYLQGLRLAFKTNEDITLPITEIQNSNVDFIYVIRGDLPRATMALGVVENGEYKWVSSDKAVFAIKAGRIIRTTGLNTTNLLATTNLSQDPLIQGQHVSIGNEWLHQADYDVPPMFNTNLIS
ncbi:hypothetical protein TI03_02590, partial [Achromatium sp. WMS1]